MKALCESLKVNTSLATLFLNCLSLISFWGFIHSSFCSDNMIGASGAETIGETIMVNSGLANLFLDGNKFQDVPLGPFLSANHSISKLSLKGECFNYYKFFFFHFFFFRK